MEDDDDVVRSPRVEGAPVCIWLVYGDIEQDCTHAECTPGGEVFWCEDKQYDSDVEYVRADTVDGLRSDAQKWRDQQERIRLATECEIRCEGG